MVDVDEVVGRFLQRAKELRRIAGDVKDADCRDTLLAWAADDDRLVDEAIEANDPAECCIASSARATAYPMTVRWRSSKPATA